MLFAIIQSLSGTKRFVLDPNRRYTKARKIIATPSDAIIITSGEDLLSLNPLKTKRSIIIPAILLK